MHPEQFSQWADLFPEALALVGSDGLIHAANRKLLAILGQRRESLQGRSVTEYAATPPDQVLAWLGLCARSRQFTLGGLQLLPRDMEQEGSHYRVEGARLFPAAGTTDPLILLRLTPRSIANQFTVLTHQIEDLHREMKARRAAEKELAKQQRWLQVPSRESAKTHRAQAGPPSWQAASIQT